MVFQCNELPEFAVFEIVTNCPGGLLWPCVVLKFKLSCEIAITGVLGGNGGCTVKVTRIVCEFWPATTAIVAVYVPDLRFCVLTPTVITVVAVFCVICPLPGEMESQPAEVLACQLTRFGQLAVVLRLRAWLPGLFWFTTAVKARLPVLRVKPQLGCTVSETVMFCGLFVVFAAPPKTSVLI